MKDERNMTREKKEILEFSILHPHPFLAVLPSGLKVSLNLVIKVRNHVTRYARNSERRGGEGTGGAGTRRGRAA